jgi:hypothetical protein
VILSRGFSKLFEIFFGGFCVPLSTVYIISQTKEKVNTFSQFSAIGLDV